MAFQIEQFMCRSDNFGVLLHDPASNATAAIDAPEEGPILDALERTGWNLTHIFVTHHHGDHTDAIKPLKHRFTPKVIGPKAEAERIAGLDEMVDDGDVFQFASHDVRVFRTPGHTAGHICFFLPDGPLLFAGDTVFAMGCGRLFEGSAADMQGGFDKLAELPDETTIYCGHEYTLTNARFALSVDPDNEALKKRAANVEQRRANDEMTLPTTLAEEKATNPFFRSREAGLKAGLGMQDASAEEVFAELRARKDKF